MKRREFKAKCTEETEAVTKEELVCPICLDTLSKPITTECFHNFCQHCLVAVLNRNFNGTCPVCRFKFTQIPDVNRVNEVLERKIHQLQGSPVEETTAATRSEEWNQLPWTTTGNDADDQALAIQMQEEERRQRLVEELIRAQNELVRRMEQQLYVEREMQRLMERMRVEEPDQTPAARYARREPRWTPAAQPHRKRLFGVLRI
jgi:hypothetical protein